MRLVWVLTVLHFIGSGATGVQANSIPTAHVDASAPHEPQTELITIGFYASKAACNRMRVQLAHAPDFKPGSARCVKQAN